MRRFLFCLVFVLLQVVSWVSATSRLLDDHPSSHLLGTDSSSKSIHQALYISKQDAEGKEERTSEAGSYRGVNKLGSKPPNCEHKCAGCEPCVAIQVPTITGHFGVQYANYEPESWKCKCGPSVYSP